MNPSSTQNLLALLELMKSFGSAIEGRVRLQKAVYLLAWLKDSPFRKSQFTYHYHGPYSSLLSSQLHELVQAELVHEDRKDFSSTQRRYDYELSKSGREVADSLPASFPANAEVVVGIAKCGTPNQLELLATALYVMDHEGTTDRDQALNRAVELKPHCKTEADETRKLLDCMLQLVDT